MEVKGLSGIVSMDVGLNNEIVVWEVSQVEADYDDRIHVYG